MLRGRVAFLFLAVCLATVFLSCRPAFAGAAEDQIIEFIKRFYTGTDVYVTCSQLPHSVTNSERIRSIGFSKVPDAAGDGICIVGIEGRGGSEMNVYVPFKVQVKRALYRLNHNVKKGDIIHLDDVVTKETFLQGAAAAYPSGIDDVVGKAAKKEIPSGEIITKQMLEEQVAVTKGEIVNMTVESKRLLVQAKGVALEKGRVGDLVRVKSVSGKEVIGTVTGSNSISVGF